MGEPVALSPSTGMGIYEIYPGLYLSRGPETTEEWDLVFGLVGVVVSLGPSWVGVTGLPDVPVGAMQVRWNIDDGGLPDLEHLENLAEMVARLIDAGRPVLVHCVAGVNRSGLLSALVVRNLTGEDGDTCAARVRDEKPGTLVNEEFSDYLGALPPLEEEQFPEFEEEKVHDGSPAEAPDGRNTQTDREGAEGQEGG